MVLNERNLIRCWDVCFNGYNGGNDDRCVKWTQTNPASANSVDTFCKEVNDTSKPYKGPSIMVMSFEHTGRRYANPVIFQSEEFGRSDIQIDPEKIHRVYDRSMELCEPIVDGENTLPNHVYKRWHDYSARMPPFRQTSSNTSAGQNSHEQISETSALAFQGTCRISMTTSSQNGHECKEVEVQNGSGHLGVSYVGVASVREGKGKFFHPMAPNNMLVKPL
jgi:hypothetical protein